MEFELPRDLPLSKNGEVSIKELSMRVALSPSSSYIAQCSRVSLGRPFPGIDPAGAAAALRDGGSATEGTQRTVAYSGEP